MLTEALKQAINDTYKLLGERLVGFRRRRSQALMIAAVARGLTSSAHAALIEAPTGTGKGYGYLVSAHAVAREQKKQLIIATGTVALQEQLLSKDIPAYLESTDIKATTVLAKGRSRYACLRNLNQLINHDEAQAALDYGDDVGNAVWPRKPRPGEPEKISRLFALAMDKKWNGDLDAPPEPIDAELSPLLSTSAGGCSNKNCKFYNSCPFVIARRGVREADIVVTNQNLLLSDLMMSTGEEEGTGGVVLPKPGDSIIVVDEAHHLPSKATEQGAARVHLASTIRALAKSAGVVRSAYTSVAKEKMAGLTSEEGIERMEAIRGHLQEMLRAINSAWVPEPTEKMPQWRAAHGRVPEDWRAIAENLRIECELVAKWLKSIRRTVLESSNIADAARERLGRDLGMTAERVKDQLDLWKLWAIEDVEGRIPRARWISLASDGSLMCHASDVSSASRLRAILFDQAAGVVLTSATLTSGGNFTWFARSVGAPDNAEMVSLPSPFDLENQASVVIPAIEALPNDFEGHVAEITRWLTEKLPWEEGNLVLYTSRAKMEAVFERLPDLMKEKVLVQGVLSRPVMLEKHKRHIETGQGSTLFGLCALGEGLDLSGRLLTTVVITQVPFSVPTDPVGATYAEYLVSQNRNPFAEVSIPDATRILTQYAGRLVRTETDTGQIVILDRRLVRQKYGKGMLASLPPFRRVIEPARASSY